ncbi:MAG: copper-binding protein [Betaproteobacteria bacterium]|nr:copper-binding protein [Betaproteobacteria bacterium]MBI2226873.1 copper-binding protein [Betaproteobacteria bacterium]MBI2290797.1 copper-binding protein [Betaproteobacteria bacterium]MBI3056141.1 copper-binding protein [Betaproteobacteria bacterium]
MTRKAIAVIMLSLSFPLSAFAVEANRQPAADAKAVSAQLADGEVRKVDKETGKVTIKHGPLVNLDMPAMTMVFRVKDPAMLDQLKAGDKINFEAAKVGGAYTVMKFETIKR